MKSCGVIAFGVVKVLLTRKLDEVVALVIESLIPAMTDISPRIMKYPLSFFVRFNGIKIRVLESGENNHYGSGENNQNLVKRN